MAVNPAPGTPPRRGSAWLRLHFLLRLAGLTGALAALVGLVLTEGRPILDLAALGMGSVQQVGSVMVLDGAALVALAVLVELAAALLYTAGQRSAFGLNAVLQILLAVVLLVGVNVFSAGLTVPVPEWLRPWIGGRETLSAPGHYTSFDLTRGGQFTIPEDLREQLARLEQRGETTVIVYQRPPAFGTQASKPYYDAAAERKVVEKVRDLAALLREVGPQLRVEVLVATEEGFDDRLERLTQGQPNLRKAIESAPENTIFIAGAGHVQQMSFNEFYQLDKVASESAQGGRGNLVLLGQGSDGRGIHPFVRRILNLEQRAPRVGVLVVHELLTTEGSEEFLNLAGLRKALVSQGFEVRDVVLRKWRRRPFRLEPAADTFEESKLDRLDAQLASIDKGLQTLREDMKLQAAAIEDMTPKPGEDTAKKLEELTKKYGPLFVGGRVTERGREAFLDYAQRSLAFSKEELAALEKKKKQVEEERDKLDPDLAAESRHKEDVKAKLSNTIADCDLLLIPRLTRRSTGGVVASPRIHRLSAEQAECVKEFLRAGKPVFACLGPTNEPPDLEAPPTLGAAGPDDLEKLLTELGFRLGKHTVLFSSDEEAFSDPDTEQFRRSTEAPPLDFESPTSAGNPRLGATSPGEENPLRQGLRVLAHSTGSGFDLRLRFPRPVYFEAPEAKEAVFAASAVLALAQADGQPGAVLAALAGAHTLTRPGKGPAYEPTFLLTASGWNEAQPFPTDEHRPRYTPPRPDDPDKGTFDAKRRGPFSVGAAVEVEVPPAWGGPKDQKVRVAVIGQGDVFVGNQLSPARERLLLQTANWLLGRNDYLPHDEHPWSYPRLGLLPGTREHGYWLWGTRLGLPVLFAYLGFVVLLFRRLR